MVVATKTPTVWPAGTVTVPGTTTTVLLLERCATYPPVGAEPVSVTVPVAGFPPVTIVGLKLIALKVGGLTVSVAF